MLRAKAPAITTGFLVLVMLALLVSGAVEMWRTWNHPGSAADTVQPGTVELESID